MHTYSQSEGWMWDGRLNCLSIHTQNESEGWVLSCLSMRGYSEKVRDAGWWTNVCKALVQAGHKKFGKGHS